MMSYRTKPHSNEWDGNVDTVTFDLGIGSQTDQRGMNMFFKALGIPLWYSRSGGCPHIA